MSLPAILVIQTAFIGDVVLATAVVEKLHHHFPGASIDMLVRKGNEELLEGHPFLRQVLVWDKKKGKLKNLFGMIRKVRSTKYDTVINLHRFASSGLMTVFSGARHTIGFDKNPLSRLFTMRKPHRIEAGIHEVDRNQSLIEHMTDQKPARPRLYPSERDFAKIKDYIGTKAFICIAPASVWFTKQWPAEKWAAFIKLTGSLRVYLLGAPNDKVLCERIAAMCDGLDIVILAGQLSFLESTALMQRAVMTFANDSAPLHLASAGNSPVTAVFCSTVTDFGFGPLSDVRNVVETTEALDCRPCGLHGFRECPLGHFRCATTIDEHQLSDRLGIAPVQPGR